MASSHFPANTGALAHLSDEEKKKRLDAMVKIWQSDTERRLQREGFSAFAASVGLDEYRYSVWLRFPEWERAVVVGQVIALQQKSNEAVQDLPTLFSVWRHDPLLRTLPDWKQHLPNETVFNISVRITPGGLGEGTRWAIIMPKEMIARYRPSWPTQQEWLTWTRSFDWLAVSVGFIHAMRDTL